MSRIRTEIVIKASADRVFSTISHLGNWPVIVPHYRWIQPLPDGSVKMAVRRGFISLRWTSRFRSDPETRELHFQHLKALTRGMTVKWTIEPVSDSETRVIIEHDLNQVKARLGHYFTDSVLGKYVIDHVARNTLTHFKRHIENKR